MKTNNTQHKAFAFLGAAFALLIALLFTACPNNAGDSGSGNVKVSFGAPLVTGGVSLILSSSKLDIFVAVETADGTDVTVEGCTETSLSSTSGTIPPLHAQSTTVVLKGNITALNYNGFKDCNNGIIAANVQGLSDLKWLICAYNKLTAQALTQILTDLPIRSPSDNAECYLYGEGSGEGNCTDFTSASAPQELKDAFQNSKTVKHWKLGKINPWGYGEEI